MTNGKSTAPKPATSRRPRAEAAATATSSDATKAAAETTKTPTRRNRGTPSHKPASDGATGLSPQERHALVAQAAYFRAEARGFAAGGELEDWATAEAEINAQLATC
jgi:hypothetical protein